MGHREHRENRMPPPNECPGLAVATADFDMSTGEMVFFDSWSGLVRVLVVGTLAYAGLVLLLRITGKRTLSKMNAFDLVVTVALGSTLATVLLSKDVALAEGLLALALLSFLQCGV